MQHFKYLWKECNQCILGIEMAVVAHFKNSLMLSKLAPNSWGLCQGKVYYKTLKTGEKQLQKTHIFSDISAQSIVFSIS